MKSGKMLSMALVTVFLSLILIGVASANAQPLNVRVGDFIYNGTGTLAGSRLTIDTGNLTYKERVFNSSNMSLNGMTFTLNGMQPGILDERGIELRINRTPPLIFNGSVFNGTTKENRFKACVDRCIELEDDNVHFSYDKGWVTLTGAKDGTTSFFIFDKDGKRKAYTVDSLGEGTVAIDLTSNITRLHNTSLHIQEKNIRVTGKNDTIIIDSNDTIVKGRGDVEVKNGTNGNGQQVTANILDNTYIVVNSHQINVNGPFVMTVVRPEKGNDNVHLEGVSSLSKATVGRGEDAGNITVENVQGTLQQTGQSTMTSDDGKSEDGKSEVHLDWTVSSEPRGAPTREVAFVAADSNFVRQVILNEDTTNELTKAYFRETIDQKSKLKMGGAVFKGIMGELTGSIPLFHDLSGKLPSIGIDGPSFSYLAHGTINVAKFGNNIFSIKYKSGDVFLKVQGQTEIAGLKYTVNVDPKNPKSLGLSLIKDWNIGRGGWLRLIAKFGDGIFVGVGGRW